jgi:molecular chaperone GrpE
MPRKKKEDTAPTAEKPLSELELLQSQLAERSAQLEEANQKAEEHREGWQRALADYANLKRRAERDQAVLQQTLVANILRRYLEISDDLERALGNRPREGEAGRWAEGVELTYRKLMNFLEAEGVSSIPAEGQFFNPTLHEAISQEDHPDFESGQIIGIVQQGYLLGDRVLRPARVRVAR